MGPGENRRHRPAAAAIAIGLIVAVAACAPTDSTPESAKNGEAAAQPASQVSFQTIDGGTASLVDYRGRVVVLNFWGTWCVPCRRELPELVELDRAFDGRDVEIIGIAVDSGDAEDVRAFADRYEIEYPLWLADMATALSEFEAVGYPFTLLIDRHGNIAKSFYGPQTVESLTRDIEALLE